MNVVRRPVTSAPVKSGSNDAKRAKSPAARLNLRVETKADGQTADGSLDKDLSSARGALQEQTKRPEGRDALAEALDGRKASERLSVELYQMEEILLQEMSLQLSSVKINVAPEASLVDIKAGKAPATALPKGADAAFVPGKNVILVRKGLSPEARKTAVTEELGERLGALAEARGIKLAPGDLGARVLKVLNGAALTKTDFVAKPSDTVTVNLNGTAVKAKARATGNADLAKAIATRINSGAAHAAIYHPLNGLDGHATATVVALITRGKPLNAANLEGLVRQGALVWKNNKVFINVRRMTSGQVRLLVEDVFKLNDGKLPYANNPTSLFVGGPDTGKRSTGRVGQNLMQSFDMFSSQKARAILKANKATGRSPTRAEWADGYQKGVVSLKGANAPFVASDPAPKAGPTQVAAPTAPAKAPVNAVQSNTPAQVSLVTQSGPVTVEAYFANVGQWRRVMHHPGGTPGQIVNKSLQVPRLGKQSPKLRIRTSKKVYTGMAPEKNKDGDTVIRYAQIADITIGDVKVNFPEAVKAAQRPQSPQPPAVKPARTNATAAKTWPPKSVGDTINLWSHKAGPYAPFSIKDNPDDRFGASKFISVGDTKLMVSNENWATEIRDRSGGFFPGLATDYSYASMKNFLKNLEALGLGNGKGRKLLAEVARHQGTTGITLAAGKDGTRPKADGFLANSKTRKVVSSHIDTAGQTMQGLMSVLDYKGSGYHSNSQAWYAALRGNKTKVATKTAPIAKGTTGRTAFAEVAAMWFMAANGAMKPKFKEAFLENFAGSIRFFNKTFGKKLGINLQPAPSAPAKIMSASGTSSFGPGNFMDAMSKAGYRFDGSKLTATADELGRFLGGTVGNKFTEKSIKGLLDSGALKIVGNTWTVDPSKLTGTQRFNGVRGILASTGMTAAQKSTTLRRLGLSVGQQDLLAMALSGGKATGPQGLTAASLASYHAPASLFVQNISGDKILGLNPSATIAKMPNERKGFDTANQPPITQATINANGDLTDLKSAPFTAKPQSPSAAKLKELANKPLEFLHKSVLDGAQAIQVLLGGELSKFDQKVFGNMIAEVKKRGRASYNEVEAAAGAAGYNAKTDGPLDEWVARQSKDPAANKSPAMARLKKAIHTQSRLLNGVALDLQVGFQDQGQLPTDNGRFVPSIFASHAGQIPRFQVGLPVYKADGSHEVEVSMNLLQHVGIRHQFEDPRGTTPSDIFKKFLPGGEHGQVKTRKISFKVITDKNGKITVGKVRRREGLGFMHRMTFDGLGTLYKVGRDVVADPHGALPMLQNQQPAPPPAIAPGGPVVPASAAMRQAQLALHNLDAEPQQSRARAFANGLIAAARGVAARTPDQIEATLPWLGTGEFIVQGLIEVETDLSAMANEAKKGGKEAVIALGEAVGWAAFEMVGGEIGGYLGDAAVRAALNGVARTVPVSSVITNAIRDSGFRVATMETLAGIGKLAGKQAGMFVGQAAWANTAMRRYTQTSLNARLVVNPLMPPLGEQVINFMNSQRPRDPDARRFVLSDGTVMEAPTSGVQDARGEERRFPFPYPNGARGRVLLNTLPITAEYVLTKGELHDKVLGTPEPEEK